MVIVEGIVSRRAPQSTRHIYESHARKLTVLKKRSDHWLLCRRLPGVEMKKYSYAVDHRDAGDTIIIKAVGRRRQASAFDTLAVRAGGEFDAEATTKA